MPEDEIIQAALALDEDLKLPITIEAEPDDYLDTDKD